MSTVLTTNNQSLVEQPSSVLDLKNHLKLGLTQDCWRLSSLAASRFLTGRRLAGASQISVHCLSKLLLPDIFTFILRFWLREFTVTTLLSLRSMPKCESVVGSNQKLITGSSLIFFCILQFNPGRLENRSRKQQGRTGSS